LIHLEEIFTILGDLLTKRLSSEERAILLNALKVASDIVFNGHFYTEYGDLLSLYRRIKKK